MKNQHKFQLSGEDSDSKSKWSQHYTEDSQAQCLISTFVKDNAIIQTLVSF